jgi:uncharacterized membrane protein
MNVEAKLLAGSLPVVEIVWARTLVHTLFVVALFGPRHGGWRLFVTRRPATQLTRSLLLLVSTSLFFTAIGRVPLADATAVSFTSPLLVAALAGPMLGERVDLKHWLAIAVGFAGALVVIRPTGSATSPYLLLVLANSACYAGYQILTRRVAAFDRPETSVSYSALIGTLALSVVAPFSFKARRSSRRSTTCSWWARPRWASWSSATCRARGRGPAPPSSPPAASTSPGARRVGRDSRGRLPLGAVVLDQIVHDPLAQHRVDPRRAVLVDHVVHHPVPVGAVQALLLDKAIGVTDRAVPPHHLGRQRLRLRRRAPGRLRVRGRAEKQRGPEGPRQYQQDGDERRETHAVATTPTRCTTLPR